MRNSRMWVGLLTTVGIQAFGATQAWADSAASYKSVIRYDVTGKVVGTIGPDPDDGGPLKFPAVRNWYDVAGNLTKVETGELSSWQPETTAPASWGNFFAILQTTITDYDALNRKVREYVLGPSQGITALTQYNYDSAGRLKCTAVRMTPAAYFAQADACAQSVPNSSNPDRITYNAYDAAGQLIQVRKGVGSNLDEAYATYSYTPNGKVEYTIDANGNRAKMEYDGFDRQTKWIFPSTARPGAFVPGNQAQVLASAGALNTADYEQYTYDANGNKTTLRKRDGSLITYQYDALNRMTAKWMPDNSPLAPGSRRNTYYFYDVRGLMTAAKFDMPDGSGEGVSTIYDGLGRITSTTLAMTGTNRTLTYQYDANGNRTRITHPDGVYFRSSYDGVDRLQNYWWAAPGGNEVAFGSVTYNANGQRAGITRGASSTTYGYGQDQRLASLSQNFANSVGNDAQAYTYNPAGQVSQETRSNPTFAFTARYNVSRNYNANGLNQYASTASTTGAGTTNNTFCHDANGNLIADGVYVYLYDIENRLIEKRQKATTNCAAFAYDGPVVAQMRYDPMGPLFETIGPATGTTHMLYDGDKLAAEYDGTGALLRRYFWGDRTDEPVLYSEGPTLDCANNRTQFFSTDRQGSIVASADCYGNFIRAWRYDEYGIPQSSDGSALRPNNGARFLYTGQALIPDAGLYYYKARMYSPSLGRFLQTDPIGYDDQVNLYAYVGNDPLNASDPTGETMVVIGSDSERRALRRAILTVARSSAELAARYRALAASKYKISAEIVSSGKSESESRSGFTTKRDDYNGRGAGSINRIVPDEKIDGVYNDINTIVAHEIFGHSWNRMMGALKIDQMVDGYDNLEETQGVETENIYRYNKGIQLRGKYDKRKVRTNDIISSGACRGTRIGNGGSGSIC